MTSILATARDAAKMVGSGVGVVVGAGLTVATAGQAEWTQDMTRWYAEGVADNAYHTGKDVTGVGMGVVNTLANGSLDPLAEQLCGQNYPEKHRQGRGHEQLQAYLVKQTHETGRWYNIAHLADHLTDNGANVQKYHNVHKSNIENFLVNHPTLYSNKLLYLTGHSTSEGKFRMREGANEWLTMEDILKFVSKAEYRGVLTVIVDSCYAGMWIRHMLDILNSHPDYMRSLHAFLDRNPSYHLRIRLRASSLKDKPSTRAPTGSTYTQCLVGRMVHEYVRASGSGNNWGVDFARNHNANSGDLCFGSVSGYGQTDMAVDFSYNSNGSWNWWCPEDRKQYL